MVKHGYEKEIEELKKRTTEISHLGSVLSLLSWDQEVNMPSKAASSRALSVGYVSGIIQDKFLELNSGKLLEKLSKAVKEGVFSGPEKRIVSELARMYERESKLSSDFVRERAEVTSKAQSVWAIARAKNDFSLFRPHLEKIIALKRKEAASVGFIDSPYDALIDYFEPGMTLRKIEPLFAELKVFLIKLLQEIKESAHGKKIKKIKGVFPLTLQRDFSDLIVRKIGFDTEAGRLDTSVHPFTSGFHPHDVRFTTRFDLSNVLESISCTLHEGGHALYDQGLPVEYFGTPLGESVSMAIHESQSRMWENLIGKSLPFWKYFYTELKKIFPRAFSHTTLTDFYHSINEVTPSFIRTAADEVTYNLHVIIRFEIEKDLIEGSLEAKDVPKVWKKKMKEYLGVDVERDSDGVLQDVHWSCGYFGYFPTYTLGNLYSAQIFASMNKDIKNIDDLMSQGTFSKIREWLRKNIHAHGKMYTAEELIQRVTGEPLSPHYFTNYLQKKYRLLYGLKSKDLK